LELQIEQFKIKAQASKEAPQKVETTDLQKLRKDFEKQFAEHKDRVTKQLSTTVQELEEAKKVNRKLEDEVADLKRQLSTANAQLQPLTDLPLPPANIVDPPKPPKAPQAPKSPHAPKPPAPEPSQKPNPGGDAKNTLLDAIRNPNVKLKHVDQEALALDPSKFEDQTMLGVLAKALVDRRKNLKEEEHGGQGSDEEWSE